MFPSYKLTVNYWQICEAGVSVPHEGDGGSAAPRPPPCGINSSSVNTRAGTMDLVNDGGYTARGNWQRGNQAAVIIKCIFQQQAPHPSRQNNVDNSHKSVYS